jgi:hypothetical protein
MAAFDFPNSPNTNDVHTENGVSFKWDGTVWKRQSGTGAQGPTGGTGAQGATGPTGAQGQKGAQAYISDAAPTSGVVAGDLWWDSDSGDFSIYFDDGSGSPSAQWVEVGSTGPTGPTGAQGAAGAAGAQGATGNAGAQGATSAQGAQGATGSGGATGAQGAQGHQGATGSGGSTGAQGAQGHQGATGSTGAQGATGSTGSQGATGSTGSQGATGSTGAQGATGSTGSQGAAGSATITGNANNRIITGGSGTNLVGEANLTWDGATLAATGSDAQLRLYDNTASSQNSAVRVMAYNGFTYFQSGTAFSSDSKAPIIFGSMFGGTEWLRIDTGGRVLIGTSSPNTFNGVGQVSNLVVAGATSDTDITDNSGASLTISNTDGTANNTAGLHFAREDTDGAPHYSGASVVAQFKEAMNTGHYPKADLAFLTSSANNNAPTEKMRIHSDGKITIATGNRNSETTTGGLLIDKDITAESDVSDKNNYHLVIRSQTNSNTSKLGIAFSNTTDDTHVGAAILHHRTSTDSIGDLSFYTSPSSGSLTEKMKIDRHGRITKPLNPAFKSSNTNQYGSAGSLTTTVANVAILLAGEEYDRGDNYNTTSKLFTCPVDGIYLVNAHVSVGNIGSNRQIWVMAYTLGGGSTPLSSYVEIIDGNTSSYANYSYCEPWYFTAGTTIGVGKNNGSGTLSGQNMWWGVHLLA